MTQPITVIHVSDLHFHCLPRRPWQWLSKRGVGAMNLLARRSRQHPLARLRRLVARLQELQWEHLVISGDLVQLGLPSEFRLAAETLAPLLEQGPGRVTIVPGNHDRYVDDSAARESFDSYFGSFFGDGTISTKELGGGWWLAGWNSAQPTGLFNASGALAAGTLEATASWLTGLPSGSQALITNHYPLFLPQGCRESPHHGLKDAEAILDWVLAHPVRVYLHGHVHHNWVLNVPRDGVVVDAAGGSAGAAAAGVASPPTALPLTASPLTIVNSAASARVLRRGEKTTFHRLRLFPLAAAARATTGPAGAVEVESLVLDLSPGSGSA